MDEQNIVTAFPLPPSYYTEFDKVDVYSPPEKPVGSFEMFGLSYQVNDDSGKEVNELKESGIEQLGDFNINDAHILLKDLHWSLLHAYTDLIDRLTNSPDKASSKLEDIRTIVLNMHYIVNHYRQHQSVHILEELLKKNLNTKKELADEGRIILQENLESLRNISPLP